MGVCFNCYEQNAEYERAEAAHFERLEWARYCAPWFDPRHPLNEG
jgi:hypothetical protein